MATRRLTAGSSTPAAPAASCWLLLPFILAISAPSAGAAEAAGASGSPPALGEVDPKVRHCTRVLNDFNFGVLEVPEYHTETGEYMGMIISKDQYEDDYQRDSAWSQYRDCIHYVTKDPWTRVEYLTHATGSHASEQVPLDRNIKKQKPKPNSVVMGAHHPVALVPGKPNFSRYFLIPAFDFVVGSFVKHAGTYDPNEENALRELTSEGDCVVEVGANIGSYTVVLADQAGKKGLVYAFEPFRKIFQILNANIALQGYGNVVTRQIGLSDKSGFVKVKAPGLNDFTNLGASRVFYQQREDIAHVPFEGMEEIEVLALDDVNFKCNQVDGSDWKRIDFLKIDSEGLEMQVVEGADRLIREHQPIVYAESQSYFQWGDMVFFHKMKTLGYMCSPFKNLEVHEIILCLPEARLTELRRKHNILR